MRRKSVAALVLAGAMTMSVMPAAVSASEDGTIAQEDLGWERPEETIVIDVYAGDGVDPNEFEEDETGGRAYMDQWLLDNLNVKFNYQYMVGDVTERLNLMLTDGSYPMVITNAPDEMANKFIEQGRAVDLTPYLDQMPNLTRRMGNYLNMLKSDDGGLYKLSSNWGESPNVATYDFGVRWDYWKELGEEKMYETPREWVETMKKILAKHPTNEDGQTTYACTSDNQGSNFLSSMLGAYGFINGYKVDENGEFTHWLNTEEGLEISKLVNEMYREGLIDPDFQGVDYDTYIAKETTGQVVGNLGTWWYAWTGGHQAWATQAAQDGTEYDPEKRIINVSVHADGLEMDDVTLNLGNFLSTTRMLITDKATEEDIQNIVKYLNWESSEIGNFIMGFGPPSEDNVWKIDENGIWLFDDEIMDVDQKEITYHPIKDAHGGGTYALAMNLQWLKDDEYGDFTQIDPRVTRVSVYDYWPVNEDGTFADDGINLSWGYYTAPYVDTTMYTATFGSRDMITMTKQTLDDNIKTYWVQIMTAESEEDCVAEFEAARDNANSLGLEELTDYYEAAYKANVEKFNGEAAE